MSPPIPLDGHSSGGMDKRYASFLSQANAFSASGSLTVLNPIQIILLLPQLLTQPRRKIQQRSIRWIRSSEQSEKYHLNN
jgi:hypothetical protein